jgi:hypothetical protein
MKPDDLVTTNEASSLNIALRNFVIEATLLAERNQIITSEEERKIFTDLLEQHGFKVIPNLPTLHDQGTRKSYTEKEVIELLTAYVLSDFGTYTIIETKLTHPNTYEDTKRPVKQWQS